MAQKKRFQWLNYTVMITITIIIINNCNNNNNKYINGDDRNNHIINKIRIM